ALDQVVPSNGRLTSDVSFVVTNGTAEKAEVIKASETSAFKTSSDLLNLLQSRLDDASKSLSIGKITAAINGDGKFAFSGPAGIKLRGNTFQFTIVGPDLSFFNQFSSGFTFDNVIKALQMIVNFLDSLTANDNSGVGGTIHTVLTTDLPVINR